MALYDIKVETISGEVITLGEYAGQALLIVNVASKCGLTPQYEGLEALHEELAPRGFTVLGFPCNQFHGQEPGTNEEIAAFCSATYGVTFPMFAKIDVKGEFQHPLYAELAAYPAGDDLGADVVWNFEKFLVSPEGAIAGRFRPTVEPQDEVLRTAIAAVLPG